MFVFLRCVLNKFMYHITLVNAVIISKIVVLLKKTNKLTSLALLISHKISWMDMSSITYIYAFIPCIPSAAIV